MAYVKIISAEGHERSVELRGHDTLGRHPDNTIQLLDRIVSKNHCHIDRVGDAYVLKDLGSLNGTFINGERVSGQRKLRAGDEIALGSTKVFFNGTPESAPTQRVATGPSSGTAQSAQASPAIAATTTMALGGQKGRVTISPGMVESHIRSKLAQEAAQNFMPERLLTD